MRRWLPYPLASVLLFGLWLLLRQSLAAGELILGALVAYAAMRGYAVLDPPPALLRRPAAMCRLAAMVVADVVRSNIAVARIVLHPATRGRTSGFVDIPLELRHPVALAALACIITATPGTSWARYDSVRGILTMHILDLVDEQTMIRTIKARYERHLLEIFR